MWERARLHRPLPRLLRAPRRGGGGVLRSRCRQPWRRPEGRRRPPFNDPRRQRLEFKVVFIVGLNMRWWRRDDEERRRVLYVGMTRARERLSSRTRSSAAVRRKREPMRLPRVDEGVAGVSDCHGVQSGWSAAAAAASTRRRALRSAAAEARAGGACAGGVTPPSARRRRRRLHRLPAAFVDLDVTSRYETGWSARRSGRPSASAPSAGVRVAIRRRRSHRCKRLRGVRVGVESEDDDQLAEDDRLRPEDATIRAEADERLVVVDRRRRKDRAAACRGVSWRNCDDNAASVTTTQTTLLICGAAAMRRPSLVGWHRRSPKAPR